MDFAPLLVAFSLGILGGIHCIGMCGGIIGAFLMAADVKSQRLLILCIYNAGRISGYLLIAAIFYSFTSFIQSYFSFQFMRVFAGLLLIAMGLYLANWWRGLTRLEALGHILWRFIQPLTQKLLPVTRPSQAFYLGLLWGWLPCGLIYSALTYSGTASSLPQALLIMFSFALGTLPAVMATGIVAERLNDLVKKSGIRAFFALSIIGYGSWILISMLIHGH